MTHFVFTQSISFVVIIDMQKLNKNILEKDLFCELISFAELNLKLNHSHLSDNDTYISASPLLNSRGALV